MSNYKALIEQAFAAYGHAQQRVRAQPSAKRVSEAIAGFAAPCDALGAALANPGANASAIRDLARSLAAQRDVLKSALERAQNDDDRTVRGVVVDQGVARILANRQKTADDQLLASVDHVLALTQADTQGGQGGSTPQPGGDMSVTEAEDLPQGHGFEPDGD